MQKGIVEKIVRAVETSVEVGFDDAEVGSAWAELFELLKKPQTVASVAAFMTIRSALIQGEYIPDMLDELRHSLENEDADITQQTAIQAAAQRLFDVAQKTTRQKTAASPTSNIHQSIGTVTGGTVTMTGFQQGNTHSHTPSPAARIPPSTGKHDLFLSYSHEDTSMMHRICDDLCAAGLRVWTDDNLTPGTPSWKKAIETAIEGARGVVVLLSPDAKQSEWVGRELDYARVQGVQVFPTLVRGEEKNAVPFTLIGSQWVDLRSEHDYRSNLTSLIVSIQTHLKTKK